MPLYYTFKTYELLAKELETFWVILGQFGSTLVRKSALPKLLEFAIVLYAHCLFNPYFTVLNVPNDRMKHPCISACISAVLF